MALLSFPELGPRRHHSGAIDALVRQLEPLEKAGLVLRRSQQDLKRYGRDAFDYSPVLQEHLRGAAAELAVRPADSGQVEAIAAACACHGVPLTLRGAGTGNYGQAVPLLGGVVLETTGLDRIRSIGQAGFTAEPGCRLQAIDRVLEPHGLALRLAPSTYRTATLAGFVAGGSGGIGSVRWGFLRDPGNLLGVEIVTLEPSPRRLQLDGAAAQPICHAYGTNGIITALTLPVAPLQRWHELLIGVADLDQALALGDTIRQGEIEIRQLALLDRPVAALMPWPEPQGQVCRPAAARASCWLVALVSEPHLARMRELVEAAHADLLLQRPERQGGGLPLGEICWNHTTLHARAVDPGWTYLQLLLPQPEMTAIRQLSMHWGTQLSWHLEAVCSEGTPRWAAMPLVRWRGTEALERLMRQTVDLGCVLFNPHVITVEDGGLGGVDAHQVAAKLRHDPAGLMNPGKLRGWPDAAGHRQGSAAPSGIGLTDGEAAPG